MNTNKALKVENNLKENANFYNNTDFTVEYVDCNDYIINWNETFIDMTDLDEIGQFGIIQMIEVATDGNLLICIEIEEEELPF